MFGRLFISICSRNVPITSKLLQVRNRSISSTIDPEELSHFKKFVGTWWDELGSMKPLHSFNKLRVPFVRDGLKHRGKLNSDFVNTSTPLKGLHIADVGCGGGILTEPLAKLGANVTGIDACKELIECAQLHANYDPDVKDNIKYIYGTLEDISATCKEAFDVVVASEILEHVASKDIFLKSCADVLKPGGSLFLTTMNRTTLSWLTGIIAAEYILKIVPEGTHDWNKFIPPHEIEKILENNNCRTCVVHGIFYNVLFNQWYWVDCSRVNYGLHAIKNE